MGNYSVGLHFIFHELLEASREAGEIELHLLFRHFVSLEEVVPRLFYVHLARHSTLRVFFLETLKLRLPPLLQFLLLPHYNFTYLMCSRCRCLACCSLPNSYNLFSRAFSKDSSNLVVYMTSECSSRLRRSKFKRLRLCSEYFDAIPTN